MWTASAATSWPPVGRNARSSGWITRSFTPSRPGNLTVATTVPITRASCMPLPSPGARCRSARGARRLPGSGGAPPGSLRALAGGSPDPPGEARVGREVLGHLRVEARDDAQHQARRAGDPAGADLDGRLHVRDRPVEEQVALAAQVVGQAKLEEMDRGALEPGVGGLEDRGDRGRLDDPQRLPGGRAARPADGGHELGMDVGQEDDVDDGRSADLATGLERLLD